MLRKLVRTRRSVSNPEGSQTSPPLQSSQYSKKQTEFFLTRTKQSNSDGAIVGIGSSSGLPRLPVRSIPEDDVPSDNDVPVANPVALLLFNRPYLHYEPNGVLMFRTDTLTWSILPPLPVNRYNCGTAVGNGKLFVVGGSSFSEHIATIDVLELATSTWSVLLAELPVPRSNCAVVVNSDRLIVIGGSNHEAGGCSASVEVCDLCSMTWSSLPNMANTRSGCGAVVHSNKLIVMGGYSDVSGDLNSGEVYSFATETWSPFPTCMKRARGWFGMAIENDRLFVIGGWNGRYEMQECGEMFDFQRNEWSALPPFPPTLPSFNECSAAVNDGKLFFCFWKKSFVLDVQSQQWTELPPHSAAISNPACFVVSL
jgi:hypothetical protein